MARCTPVIPAGTQARRIRRIAAATACCSDSSRCWLRVSSLICCPRRRAKRWRSPTGFHRPNTGVASGLARAGLHTGPEPRQTPAPTRRRADAFIPIRESRTGPRMPSHAMAAPAHAITSLPGEPRWRSPPLPDHAAMKPTASSSSMPAPRRSPPRIAARGGALLLAAACMPQLAHACATCGCTLSTDAATGYSTASGWRINLDYTYIDQNQLRHGSGKASPGQVVDQPSDPSLGGGEIEKGTPNRYINLGATYRFNADWGVSFVVPYVIRDHDTYGTQLAPYTPGETAPDQVSGAHVAGLGDVKLIGSYQGFLPTHNFGVQFGIKLPTGHYGGQTDDGMLVGRPTTFHSGPGLGQSLDSSLQAGTGSTDLIVGAYYFQPVSQDFDMFVSGQFQAAVRERLDRPGADFRP